VAHDIEDDIDKEDKELELADVLEDEDDSEVTLGAGHICVDPQGDNSYTTPPSIASQAYPGMSHQG
jgi:hypothetical protein